MRGELSEYVDGFRMRVRLLANTTATAEFLPATLATFLTQHPLIDIELEERSLLVAGFDFGCSVEYSVGRVA